MKKNIVIDFTLDTGTTGWDNLSSGAIAPASDLKCRELEPSVKLVSASKKPFPFIYKKENWEIVMYYELSRDGQSDTVSGMTFQNWT